MLEAAVLMALAGMSRLKGAGLLQGPFQHEQGIKKPHILQRGLRFAGSHSR